MKKLQHLVGAAVLTGVLSLSASAGDLHSDVHTAGEISTDVTTARAGEMAADVTAFFGDIGSDIWAMLAGIMATD